MSGVSVFWQWAGFLANPVRRADIQVETHPKKEGEFRSEYLQLTGEPLLLPGNSVPFYVWPEGVNKYGIQRRAYFRGELSAIPPETIGFQVKPGRAAGTLRINNGNFIRRLFAVGFLIGRNEDCAEAIRMHTPAEFASDFDLGFNIMSSDERTEQLVREYCEEKGTRTIEASDLKRLLSGHGQEADLSLRQLSKSKIIRPNNSRGVYTLLGAELLRDEIESKSLRQAVRGEVHPDRREILLETWARDRGWVRLAKKTFGDRCMCENCTNTFIKENGGRYVEAHHIEPLHAGGEDGVWNLSVLCAHHHRMAHFARAKDRRNLQNYLQKKNLLILASLGI